MKRQHYKGKKRPRAWHRSKSSSRRYWKAVAKTNEMFRRAEEAA